MQSFKVVIFGDIPLATKLAEFFILRKDMLLNLVVIGKKKPNNNDPFIDTPLLEEFSLKEKIPIIYDFEKFKSYDFEFDIGVSVRFSKLIPDFVIKKFKYGIINLHGGLLPKFAGSNSCVHALIENSNSAGGTIHWINNKIDRGFIINKNEFKIESTDTAFTLFQKTQQVLLEMTLEFFKNLSFLDGPKENQIYKYDQNQFRFFKKDDLLDKRNLTKYFYLNDHKSLHRNIRAFTFPGKEKAYIVVNQKRIYLSANPI